MTLLTPWTLLEHLQNNLPLIKISKSTDRGHYKKNIRLLICFFQNFKTVVYE